MGAVKAVLERRRSDSPQHLLEYHEIHSWIDPDINEKTNL